MRLFLVGFLFWGKCTYNFGSIFFNFECILHYEYDSVFVSDITFKKVLFKSF